MKTSPPSPRILLLLGLVSAACSGGELEAKDAASREATVARERWQDPAAVALRAHLDLGRAEAARGLLRSLEGRLGKEARLLAARLAALDGEPLEAMRLVEAARAADPLDPEVFATAVELHAGAGRFETAGSELRRGIERCRATPELLRAQGVLQLCQPGGAARGVQLIETALSRDSRLPFTDRALGQGYLLLAKESLAAGDLPESLARVERSLAHDPDEVDARRVRVDILAAAGDLAGASRELRELVDQGHPYQGELALMYKRAGIAALVQDRRQEALLCFQEARALGLGDEELGTGAHILEAESERAVEAGTQAYQQGDFARARERFREALSLCPDSLVAHNHLAVALFRLEDFEGAAEHFRRVLDMAVAEELSLPEPVHLNLAKALYRSHRLEEARTLLREWLERDPEGLWAPDTRAMLEHLGE